MSKPAAEDGLASRASISTAAVRLFRTQGYDATTVDQVARAAGTSRATVFRYFGTKEDILFHRYDRELKLLSDGVAASKGSDARRARSVLLALACRLEGEGRQFRLELELIATNPKLRARALMTLHAWGCVLAGELAAGRGPEADLPARVLAHAGVAALQEALCTWLAHPDTSLVEVTTEALGLALPGSQRRRSSAASS